MPHYHTCRASVDHVWSTAGTTHDRVNLAQEGSMGSKTKGIRKMVSIGRDVDSRDGDGQLTSRLQHLGSTGRHTILDSPEIVS